MTADVHKKAKIIGNPGCGKTTYLFSLIEQAANKYDPERIGAVSLTNAAVEELCNRVRKQAGIKSVTKNIKTIHALLFRLLELKKDQVADKRVKEFNEAYPKWRMSLGSDADDNEPQDNEYGSGFTPDENSRRFIEIQILRHKLVSRDEWPPILDEMYHDWQTWMYHNGLIDFTGMLESGLEQELCPEIDILLVDEAQDMSRLSMNILEMWGRNTISSVYAGDSDQAILRFAGAVPEAFINLDNTWTKVLGQSYRIPQKVYDYAMKVIVQAKNREEVEYKTTDIKGQVIECNEPDLSLPGLHMIIGRCHFHLDRWREWLIKHNLSWFNPYRPGDQTWNPLNTKLWGAARNYVRIKNGEDIPKKSFENMVKEIISKTNLVRGAKQLRFDLEDQVGLFHLPALGIFTDDFLSFKKPLHELFSLKGQTGMVMAGVSETEIMKDPNILLGTYHSIKGGECDHVWIDTGTSPKCWKAMKYSPEALWDEARVAYVAVTRAKQTVGLLKSTGLRNRVWVGI